MKKTSVKGKNGMSQTRRTVQIYIDNEGNVSGLANDIIDNIVGLGPKTVERVSDVEFDHTAQNWVARDLQGETIATDLVRSEVIRKEEQYFNARTEAVFLSRNALRS